MHAFASAPGLRGRLAAAHRIFAHAALSDVDAEFEQFAVDSGCTPIGILPADLADQVSDREGNDGSSGLTAPHRSRANESRYDARLRPFLA